MNDALQWSPARFATCPLVEKRSAPATQNSAKPQAVTFVTGLLRLGRVTVPVLNPVRVVSHCKQPSIAVDREATR
jgi:hypothetical protein